MRPATRRESRQGKRADRIVGLTRGGLPWAYPIAGVGRRLWWMSPMAGERILIVDDNAMSLKLAAYLMQARGYDVTVAVDAEAALDAIDLQHPDVMLMDIQLPGIDGLELVRRLRADVTSQHLLIIAVTAYAMKGDQERALAAGCDGYITKPIDTRSLPDTIARYLDGRRMS
jgi:two-component system cell cycle response regulator DivK